MPAELVLPALSALSGQSTRPESASAFHQVAPESDVDHRLGVPSPAGPAPYLRRHGAYGRSLLSPDIQRGGGGGQSVEWFFDTVSHEWLIRFVEHRIADVRMIRLIRKWLKAGVMEDGQWSSSEAGTPQGAVVTPRTQKVTFSLNV